MDIKPNDLKKWASACRKAGIKSFKGEGFEFTLTDDQPLSYYKRRKLKSNPAASSLITPQEMIETDTLTEDQLLFWSGEDPLLAAMNPRTEV